MVWFGHKQEESKTMNSELISELRKTTGAGISDCVHALRDANENVEEAISILRKKGLTRTVSNTNREATEGLIGSYIHYNGKIGALVHVSCETDFAARTDEFKTLCQNIAMHIAASNPKYIDRSFIPIEQLQVEKTIYTELAIKNASQPLSEEKIQMIVAGQMEKRYSELCLLDQPFVIDPKRKIIELIKEVASKLKENIIVRKFVILST